MNLPNKHRYRLPFLAHSTHFQQKIMFGFTLMELLVTMAVLGVLSSIVITALSSSGFQARGRDAQRKSDIEAVRTALELYAVSQVDRKYPTGPYANLAAPLSDYLDSSLPTDPSDGSDYTYSTNAARTGFCLSATLEAAGAGTYLVRGGQGC